LVNSFSEVWEFLGTYSARLSQLRCRSVAGLEAKQEFARPTPRKGLGIIKGFQHMEHIMFAQVLTE
jgi:hypothetical protein